MAAGAKVATATTILTCRVVTKVPPPKPLGHYWASWRSAKPPRRASLGGSTTCCAAMKAQAAGRKCHTLELDSQECSTSDITATVITSPYGLLVCTGG